MSNKPNALLEFGNFRLDPRQRLLFSSGQPVPLTPKAIETLLLLVEAEGRVIAKEELLHKIWPDTFVEEGSLARNISVLRKALGESPDDQKYIQTIPKRGYRFVAPVASVAGESPGKGLPRRNTKLALGIAAALLAACLAAWQARPHVRPAIRSVAVLPLQNLSGDPAQEYFSDGITDALITSLAQIRALKVISRTSTLRYKSPTKSLREIARELGADAILEGTVQREGSKVRISAQLIQAATDTHIWARSYQRDLSDMLRLEGELASVVAAEIQVQIEPETRRRLQGAPQVSPTAQDEYLLARHQQDKRDEEHLKQAIKHFETAIRLAPDFAPAYAGLGHAWVQRGVLGAAGFRASEAPARSATLRAIELDPQLAEAHAAMAHVLMFYDLAWATSEQEFQRAIELDPNNVDAHVYYATLLEVLGRYPEAIAEGKRALELDPVSVMVNSEYGRVLFRARRYEESIRQYQRTLELDPQDSVTLFRLADAYIEKGRLQDALSIATPGRPQAARVYALLGRREEARRMLSTAAPSGRLDEALAYFAMGDRDRGFAVLTQAFDDRRYVNLVACDPRWDIVRDDPRFHALINRLGLPR